MKALLAVLLLVVVSGCGIFQKEDAAMYLNRDTEVARARAAEAEARRSEANAEAARYRSMEAAMKRGGQAAATGVALLATEGVIRQLATKQSSVVQQVPAMPPQKMDFWGFASRLTEVALPVLGMAHSVNQNAKTARVSATANRDIMLGAFGANQGIAGLVQSPTTPQANVSTVTNTYTLSGTGVLGNGTYSDTRTASGAGSSTAGSGAYNILDDHGVYSSYNPYTWHTIP